MELIKKKANGHITSHNMWCNTLTTLHCKVNKGKCSTIRRMLAVYTIRCYTYLSYVHVVHCKPHRNCDQLTKRYLNKMVSPILIRYRLTIYNITCIYARVKKRTETIDSTVYLITCTRKRIICQYIYNINKK